jgi:hypothetical protein
MKLAGVTASVWPGYVAAIASLVLSLLLLLAILVISITQVGSIVGQYMQELLRAELLHKANTTNFSNEKLPAKFKATGIKGHEITGPNAPLNQIKVVFTRKLADIPLPYIEQIHTTLKTINAPAEAKWIIWAAVDEKDALIERATYRFMLAIRRILIQQGIKESQIDMRLQKSKLAPVGYEQGEISVYFGPLQVVTSLKRQP